jgi:hypothetical protein
MKSQHDFENNPLMVFFHCSLQTNVVMTTMCDNNMRVATLTLGLQPKQRFAKVLAKCEG